LIRSVEAAGGFATVLYRGERESGTILIVLTRGGVNSRLYERLPGSDFERSWQLIKTQDPGNPTEFSEYLIRRSGRDPDLWIVELDIADGERFIGLTG